VGPAAARPLCDEALRLGLRAVELDPQNPGANGDVAGVYVWLRRYPEANRYAERADALEPGAPSDYGANIVEWLGGDAARARALLRKSVARFGLAPLVTRGGVETDWGLVAGAGDTALLKAADRLALRDLGGDSMAYYRTKLHVAHERGAAARERAYADSLRAVLEPKVREQPDAAALHSRLAIAYAGLGRRADAVREARRGVELDPVERDAIDGAFRLVDLAFTYARVGEEDAAVETFARLLAIPSPIAAPGLRATPARAIAALRRNPRFQRLLAAQP